MFPTSSEQFYVKKVNLLFANILEIWTITDL